MDATAAESESDYKAAYLAERVRVARLEEKLTLAKEAKRSFLATVSHEIRTPLNGIMTVAQMLITDSDGLSDKQKRQTQTILKCSVQLLMCVNDILDYAKLKSKSLRIVDAPFSLPDLMRDLNEMFAAQADEKQIAYVPSLQLASEDATHYMGDEKRVCQILQNLFNNALRFSPAGSRITLHMYTRPAQEQEQQEKKQRVYFVLTDGGPGIQHEESELIFDPFRQSNTVARPQGSTATTGLGLAIARGLAEQMGGKLWLEAANLRAPGDPQGARFVFYVTLAATEAEAHMLKERGHLLQSKRVLIVDDMLENRLRLAQLAAKWHMLPHLCSSGEEALLYLHTMSYEFDLGWIDVHMLGMSGVELAQAIRKGDRAAAKNMPLISLSSVGNEFANRALFNVSLEKPVVEQQLLKHTLALLCSSSAPPAPPPLVSAPAPQRRPLNILIADDDETSRQVLRDVLEMFPAHQIEHVKVVNDGDQALRHLLPHSQRYDVAILDILMPGTNGLECARKIRQTHSHGSSPAIVILTANVSEQTRLDCDELGVDAFLTKPLEIQDIFSVLQRIYDRTCSSKRLS